MIDVIQIEASQIKFGKDNKLAMAKPYLDEH